MKVQELITQLQDLDQPDSIVRLRIVKTTDKGGVVESHSCVAGEMFFNSLGEIVLEGKEK